jgi:hypothetical protein
MGDDFQAERCKMLVQINLTDGDSLAAKLNPIFFISGQAVRVIHTILLTFFFSCAASSYAQSTIFKCIEKGKTVYSESPCPIGTKKQTAIDTTPEYMGNQTYDRNTIDAARARIRAGMNETGVVVSSGKPMPIGAGTAARNASQAQKNDVCNSIAIEINNLNAWARNPQGTYSLDWIRQRKIEVERTAYDWGC